MKNNKDILDVFDIAIIIRELQILVGYHIDKIYQQSDEIFIKIKNKEKDEIFIKNSCWICLTKQREEDTKHPPTFAMTLRKYLKNGKILRILQYNFDRIIVFEIKKEKIYHLIIELLPNGNIILTDEEKIIIASLKYQKWSKRTIKIGELHKFPSNEKNLSSITFDDFKMKVQEGYDLIRGLVSLGIPGKWAEEICLRTDLPKDIKQKYLDEKQILVLYNKTKSLINEVNERKIEPQIITKKGEYLDVIPFSFNLYKDYNVEHYQTFNEALNQYYIKNIRKTEIEEQKDNSKKAKLIRQLNQQKKAIIKFKEEEKKYKNEGEAIFNNYEYITKILNQELKPKRINYPIAIIEIICNNKIREIEINLEKTLHENANIKYELSKKMRDKIKGGEEAIKSTVQKIEGEDEKKPLLSLMKIKKTYWFENYRWFISSNGNIVVAGKNAKTNDRLVKKHLEKDDLYVHADFHGAPSCIIKPLDVKNKKRNIDEKTIEEACIFAVSYSRAWKQGGSSNAYWVYPYQVSKTPQSGEFLPKGAFIIRGKRNYQKCKLELAIGKIYIENQQKIMGGPVTAVKKITNHYVVFSPGDKTKEEIAKYLINFFKVTIEDIQSVLPAGKTTKLEESK